MDNNNLNKAFRALSKAGYFAKQNFLCCQTCGWAAMTEEQAKKAVFYHAQDNDDKKDNRPFHLAWAGDGNEICKILNANNVKTDWDGSDDKRICVISW